ncbi:hypothetical protein ACFL1H_04755 [Nanoarchaeota archaeon]
MATITMEIKVLENRLKKSGIELKIEEAPDTINELREKWKGSYVESIDYERNLVHMESGEGESYIVIMENGKEKLMYNNEIDIDEFYKSRLSTE